MSGAYNDVIEEGTSVKECIICNNEFDEDERSPRTLPCAHTFCTVCIHELIHRNNKACPSCRQPFFANSVKLLGKNTTALGLLERVRKLETHNVRSVPKSEIIKRIKLDQYEVLSENISDCKIRADQLKTLITGNAELERIISQNLMEIKRDIKNKLDELEEKCEAKLQFIKHDSEQLKKIVTECENKQKDLHHMEALLVKATTIVMVDTAIDEAEALNNEVQSRLQRIKTEVAKDEKIQQGISESMKAINEHLNCVRESLTLALEDGDGLIENMGAKVFTKEDQTQIPQILQRMSATTRVLVSLQGVYVFQQEGPITRYGKLSVFEKKLFLHHLTERQIPLIASKVKFNDVMRLVNPSSRLTFLDFGHKQSRTGRILVRLAGDTKRAQNFSLLCSGEQGLHFEKTRVFALGKQGSFEDVVCGGYYMKDSVKFKALVAGAGEETGGLLQQIFAEGSVFGCCIPVGAEHKYVDSVGSSFGVVTKLHKICTYPAVFGMVEEGLDVLQAFTLYPNPKEIEIRDCGIVLID